MGYLDEMLEHYRSLAIGDESTLVVRGASVQEVVDALGGVPLDDVPEDELDSDEPIWATYTLTAIEGGVLASEDTGYADPPTSVLVTLSKDGRAAAVVRNNIQAHCRFGCARDGELLFDNDEYPFVTDRDSVPQELRTLFDLAWVGLTGDGLDPQVDDSTAVALAMAEVCTGIRLTSADSRTFEGGDAAVAAVRLLQYASEKENPRLSSDRGSRRGARPPHNASDVTSTALPTPDPCPASWARCRCNGPFAEPGASCSATWPM